MRYNNGHTAIYDVAFALQGGTICALVGVNGSGKSTLFKSIMGLIKPQQGNIALCGLPINRALKQNLVAYVPQAEEVDWQFPVSVYDVVMMGRYGYMNFLRIPKAEDKQKVLEAMQRVNIEHLAERQIGELSGGQKRRVSIGIELLSPSPYFILDEPSSGLDALSDRNLLRTLKILAKSANKSIVVITHNTENLAIFDKIIFLSKGRPTFAGTYEELLLEYKTSDPYMIRKYMDMNIADVYQELNASTRIYKI